MIIRPVQIQTHLIYFIFIFWYVSISHCSYFPFSLKNLKKLAGYSIRLHCNINKLCYYKIFIHSMLNNFSSSKKKCGGEWFFSPFIFFVFFVYFKFWEDCSEERHLNQTKLFFGCKWYIYFFSLFFFLPVGKNKNVIKKGFY